jgi:hypothetical protein
MIPNINVHALLGKFILVFLDIMVGYLILNLKTTSNDKMKLIQICSWLFNPFIFMLSARGSSDVVVTFLLFVTFYYFQNKKYFYCFL